MFSNRTASGKEIYALRGGRGRCYVCQVEFTSDQNANQHLSGQKHIKKVAAFDIGSAITDSHSFTPLILPTTSSIFPSPLISRSLNTPSTDLGLQPEMNQFPKVSSSHQLGPNGEPYIMNGTRGTCFVCNLELTSKEHANSHLKGQKHQKKCAAVGILDKVDNVSSAQSVVSDASNFSVGGRDPTTQPVLMCSICQAPFSCMDNAKQHFMSEKHKKKVKLWEAQQLSSNANIIPQSAGIKEGTVHRVPVTAPDVETIPKQLDSSPVQHTTAVSSHTQSELSTVDKSMDTGGNTIPKQLDSSVLHLMSNQDSVLHFQPSFSMLTYSDNGSYTTASPTQQANRWKSKEINNPNSGKLLNCNLSSGMEDVAKLKSKELLLSQNLSPSTMSSSTASTISSAACSSISDNCLQSLYPQQKNESPIENQAPFKFQSLPGFQDGITLKEPLHRPQGLDSKQVQSPAQSELPQKPHQGESQIRLGLDFSQLSSSEPPEIPQNPCQTVTQITHGLKFSQESPFVQPESHHNKLEEVRKGQMIVQEKSDESTKPAFTFDGQRGHCNACNVELTSRQLADQHLNGQKHQKRAAQWEVSQQKNFPMPAPPLGVHLQPAAPPQNSPTDSPVNFDNDTPDKTCYFNGCRGFCLACNIEITSRQHYDQHRLGKPHSRSRNRYILSQQGVVYPLFCYVCKKPFTGQESAKQHFESSRHINKLKIFGGEGQLGGREVERLETGCVIMIDSEVWFICDICDSRFNTRNQYISHLQGDKHKKAEIIAAQDAGSEASSRGQSPHVGSVASCNSPRLSLDSQEVERILADNAQHLKYLPHTPINSASLPQKVRGSFDWSSALHSTGSTRSEPTPRSHIPTERYGVAEGFTPPNREGVSPRSSSSSGFNSLGPSMSTTPVKWSSGGHYPGAGSAGGSGGRLGGGTGPDCVPGGPGRGNEATNRESPLGAGTDNSCGEGGTIEGDGNPGESTSSRRVNHDLGNFVKRPQAPHRSANRPPAVGRLVSNLDYTEGCDSEEEDSEYLRLEEQPKPNICEEGVSGLVTQGMRNLELGDRREAEQVTAAQQVPEAALSSGKEEFIFRSSKPGCRYFCQLCNQHMNTYEDKESHLRGKYHQYNVSMRPAPVRTLPPVRKRAENVVERAYRLVQQVPRVYQVELLCSAMEMDRVIYLPTGTGKTLVAVMAICMMLQENPYRPVLFLVDKVLLVLQQEKYIRSQIGDQKFKRPDIKRDGCLVERELFIKAICGGLFSKSDTPIWKSDIVVTTADFCHNMLRKNLIRWEDFSLVVLDEVHHCFKNHPYLKLMSYHPPTQRLQQQASGSQVATLGSASISQNSPKILGLSASPASKDSVDLTYNKLKQLLANLGGAQIAMVMRDQSKEDLKLYVSNTNIQVKCVPMSSQETEFTQKLLEYFVLCYVKLASLCPTFKKAEEPFCYFKEALSGTQEAIKVKAKELMKDFEPVQELMPHLLNPTYSGGSSEVLFTNLKNHMMTVILSVSDVAVYSNNVSETLLEELKPSPNIQMFEEYGIPCSEIRKSVAHFAETGSKDMTMQNKLLETLMDPTYIDWSDPDCKALVLVQRRHEARCLANVLKSSEFAKSKSLRVTYMVGHGRGAQDGGMDVRKQKKLLDNAGKYHLFVATSIMEEGVDFQSLQLVVCLNPPTSVRALVQIRGRARKRDSHFVILCKEQEEEKKLKTLMDQEQNMEKAALRCLAEAGQAVS